MKNVGKRPLPPHTGRGLCLDGGAGLLSVPCLALSVQPSVTTLLGTPSSLARPPSQQGSPGGEEGLSFSKGTSSFNKP